MIEQAKEYASVTWVNISELGMEEGNKNVKNS